jgi:hypothetical protein
VRRTSDTSFVDVRAFTKDGVAAGDIMEEAQLKRPLLFAPHFSYKNDALLCRYRLGTKREPGAAAAAESTAALSNFTARVDVYKGIHVEPGERIRIRATVLIAASIDDDVTVTLRQRPMGETSQAAQTNLTMVQVTGWFAPPAGGKNSTRNVSLRGATS